MEVPIAHLAYCSGSWGNLLFPEDMGDMGDMERLAGAGGTAPSEEAWRALTQTARLTDNAKLFRGQRRHMKHLVMLPRNTSWSIQLKWDQDWTPKERVRMRVGLDGAFQNEIEIG